MEKPVAPVLIALMLRTLFGGQLTKRIGQPTVLGELMVGMLLANVAYDFHEPTLKVSPHPEGAR